MRGYVIRVNIIWFGYRNKKMNQWFINYNKLKILIVI